MWGVLRDLETSALDDRHKALFRFVQKVNADSPRIGPGDMDRSARGRLGRRGDLLRHYRLRAVQLLQPLDRRQRRARALR